LPGPRRQDRQGRDFMAIPDAPQPVLACLL
jgi:hypothetical protein